MNHIKEYNNNYIGPLQYMVLVIYLSRSLLLNIGYSNIINISKLDSYISILLGIIIGSIFILLLCYLNKKNINLLKIKILIIPIILLIFIVLLFDLINFINIKYLFNTSKLFIFILLFITIIYISNKDIETIGRSSLLIFFINIIIFFIISISLIKYIDLNNLKPMFKTHLNAHIHSIILFLVYSIIPLLILNIIPKNSDYKIYNKSLIIGYIISSISSLIFIFLITTTNNYQYISKFNYPLYITIQKIEYNFISSPENILSFFFIIDYYYSLIIYMYLLKYCIKKK